MNNLPSEQELQKYAQLFAKSIIMDKKDIFLKLTPKKLENLSKIMSYIYEHFYMNYSERKKIAQLYLEFTSESSESDSVKGYSENYYDYLNDDYYENNNYPIPPINIEEEVKSWIQNLRIGNSYKNIVNIILNEIQQIKPFVTNGIDQTVKVKGLTIFCLADIKLINAFK